MSLSIYSELELSMGKNCCIEGCTRGLLDGKFRGFHFPLKSRPDIAAEWIKFVGKENWTPTGNNALCYEHFENTLINRGSRWTLDWKLSPIPTLYPPAVNRLKRKASIVRDSEGGKKRTSCRLLIALVQNIRRVDLVFGDKIRMLFIIICTSMKLRVFRRYLTVLK